MPWWAALTLPGGDAFVYADGAASSCPFADVRPGLASTHGPLADTLTPLYGGEGASPLSHACWNDAPPGAPASAAGAHAKGCVFWDEATRAGVWLAHSVPHWPPPLAGRYRGPAPQQRVFQHHFLCVALDRPAAAALTALFAAVVSPHV